MKLNDRANNCLIHFYKRWGKLCLLYGVSDNLLHPVTMGDTQHHHPPDKPSWYDMAENEQTSGGVTAAPPARRSWASVLGTGLPQRSDNNVLEVVLEKDQRGSFTVSETECVNMMCKLGLDTRPGVHVEGVQICPQGRGVIYITLKKQVEVSRFCKYEVIEVTRSGTRAVLAKPAGKREVVVTARGIHPNTLDEVVVDYLGKFGSVVTKKVVYGVYTEGPLKGIKNGDRSYKMEVKPGNNLGSYHAIDGHKVTLRYPGQQQTCARCHQTPQNCKGRGVARRCEAEGGKKVDFIDHILDLWKIIGYSPQNPEAITNIETAEDDLQQQEGGYFTPTKESTTPEKYTGVSIKHFPRNTDDGLIMEFLIECGLPEIKKENVSLIRGVATVKDLDNEECRSLIDAIHGKIFFDKKLYCNGIIALTPEKPTNETDPSTAQNPGKPLPPGPHADLTPEKPANETVPSTAQNPGNPLPPGPHADLAASVKSPRLVPHLANNSEDYTSLTGTEITVPHPLGLHPVPHTPNPGHTDDDVQLTGRSLAQAGPPPAPNTAHPGHAAAVVHLTGRSQAQAGPPYVQQTVHLGHAAHGVHLTGRSQAQTGLSHVAQTVQPGQAVGVQLSGRSQAQAGPHPVPPSQVQEQFWNLSSQFDSRETMVRRHSLSTIDRTPPSNSLAADILDLNLPKVTLSTSRSILSNISQIQESLSDFNSCVESQESSSSLSEEEADLKQNDEFKTAKDKRREKKNKRKIKWTPSKDQFLKKQNTQISPTN